MAYTKELWAAPAALTIIVRDSMKESLISRILTSHLNLLWHNKGDCVVYIKGCLIRHSENGVIVDELDLKNVFNLKIVLEKRLPCHWKSDLAQRIEEGCRILGRQPSSHSMIRLSCSHLSQDSL
jgi:hypothetical protein